MAGCNECKFYKSELGNYLNGSFQIKRSCKLGNNDEMNNWWIENGKKKKSEPLTYMDCHDYHDSTKALVSLNNKAQEILDILKK